MSRTLNLRGTFTEGESRNLNGRILRNTSNPNPPPPYRDWETDRKSTRLNSSHSGESRMPSSA